MASTNTYTFADGYKRPAPPRVPAETDEVANYTPPDPVPLPTSTKANEYGIFNGNTFPSVLAGTSAPGDLPKWFKKESEVDVLICGAGPSGLEIAVSLLRQGVSFRIVDKADAPLLAGRADGVQPRFLETVGQWGLATEIAEEGPLIEKTAIWKDGRNLVFGQSHQSDSRYRGLHVITQTAIEHVYIRDLLRHKKLVERSTTVKSFTIDESPNVAYPVSATLVNEQTGATEAVRAKFLVGADGANSTIRKQIGIKFEGVTTDIHWGIMDAVFETDYPHAGVFGMVISSEHGGCAIIPREDGMIRLYTEISSARHQKIASEHGGSLDIRNITPEDILAQAQRIFHPFKIKFGSPLSWFTVWNISERVAERYSYKNRVHLVGDACHVHSVLGAFGLNASVLDASNLAWKLGFCARGLADPAKLMPTYEQERRRHAVRIIDVSGTYLRFISLSSFDVPGLKGLGTEPREDEDNTPEEVPQALLELAKADPDKGFLAQFFIKNGAFLLGVDVAYGHNVINPGKQSSSVMSLRNPPKTKATEVRWGVRAPNPRITLSRTRCGYLYDAFAGPDKFTIVVFGSDLKGPVRRRLSAFNNYLTSSSSFLSRIGHEHFRFVLVTTNLPDDIEEVIVGEDGALKFLQQSSTIVTDDQLPGVDAHTTYGVSHALGAVVVVRPDLWTGISVLPDEGSILDEYFTGFLRAPVAA